MTDKARLGVGNVEIELDGETRTLKPTLRAARTISTRFGGFQRGFDAVASLDLEAYIAIITAGLGAKPGEADEIADAVWSTGMPTLTEPVIEYLTNLANGGRPLSGGSGEENPQAA